MASANDYEVLEVIGQGSFGQIRKVRRKSDGLILVRKEISYVKMSQKEREQLQTEFQLLATLKHPNIVEYFHRDHIKSDSMLHLYMEYCGNGDLSQVIKQCQQDHTLVPEHLVWSIFAQIVLALFRCHWGVDPPSVNDVEMVKAPPKGQFTVLHRDLKPENVFLDKDNSVKLGDFGLSKLLHSDTAFATTYVGTPFYMSPELIKDLPYTSKSDIWSLGCVIYELCKLSPPFNAKTHFNLCQKIKEGKYPSLPSLYSAELRAVIAECLCVDPKQRPDTARLLNVPSIRLARREQEAFMVQRTLKMEREKLHLREQQLLLRESDLAKREAQLNNELLERGKVLDLELRQKWAVAAEAEVQRRVEEELAVRVQEVVREQLPRLVEEEISRRLASLDIPLPSDDELTSAVAAVPGLSMSCLVPPSPGLRLVRRRANSNSVQFEETNPDSPGDVEMDMSPYARQQQQQQQQQQHQPGSPRRRSAGPMPPPDPAHDAPRRPEPHSFTTAPAKQQGNLSSSNLLPRSEKTLQNMFAKPRPSLPATVSVGDDSEFSPLRLNGTSDRLLGGHTGSAPNLPGMIRSLSVAEGGRGVDGRGQGSPTRRPRRKVMGSSDAKGSAGGFSSVSTSASSSSGGVLQPIQPNTLGTPSSNGFGSFTNGSAFNSKTTPRGKSLLDLRKESQQAGSQALASQARQEEDRRVVREREIEMVKAQRGLRVRIEGMRSEEAARWREWRERGVVGELPEVFLT